MSATNRARWLAAALLCVGPLVGQVAVFDAEAAAAAESDGEERGRHAARAVAAFLRIEPGDGQRRRLERAAQLALQAQDWQSALDWSVQARREGLASPAAAATELTACLELDRGLQAAERAMALDEADGQVLRAWLQAQEARLLPLADRLLRAGHSAAGSWLFQAIADRLPPAAHRFANLALCLRHLGRLDEAEAAYRRALDIAPEDGWTWNDLGLLLRVAGKKEQASAAFARGFGCDAVQGEGPAVTNLVLQAVLDPDVDAPWPQARAALAVRPDAQLLRRALIDLVILRQGQGRQQPPTKPSGAR